MQKSQVEIASFCLWKFWGDKQRHPLLCNRPIPSWRYGCWSVAEDALCQAWHQGGKRQPFLVSRGTKSRLFPPQKKTGEFLINQWYPKMYAENSHALQVFKKFIGKKSHGFSIPSFKAFPEKNVFLKRTECKNSLLRLMKSCSSLSDFHTGTMDTPIGNRNRWWKFRTRSFCIKH